MKPKALWKQTNCPSITFSIDFHDSVEMQCSVRYEFCAGCKETQLPQHLAVSSGIIWGGQSYIASSASRRFASGLSVLDSSTVCPTPTDFRLFLPPSRAKIGGAQMAFKNYVFYGIFVFSTGKFPCEDNKNSVYPCRRRVGYGT